MAKKNTIPVTAAIRALRQAAATFETHSYRYEAHSGAHGAAEALGIEEHQVVKTLIMEDEDAQPMAVLMPGDCRVNTGELARQLERKRVGPCTPEIAQRRSGYLVGGTSPFGLKDAMPIIADVRIQALPVLWINGGKRGIMVSLTPDELTRVLTPTWVEVALLKDDQGSP